MARAFATSPKEVKANHLSLLYAHLQDDCVGPVAKYINIEILPRALPLVVMSGGYHPERRKSERDLETIRQHLWHDEQLQKVIREIAQSLRRKPLPELPTEKPRPL